MTCYWTGGPISVYNGIRYAQPEPQSILLTGKSWYLHYQTTADHRWFCLWQKCNDFIHFARLSGGSVLIHWWVIFHSLVKAKKYCLRRSQSRQLSTFVNQMDRINHANVISVCLVVSVVSPNDCICYSTCIVVISTKLIQHFSQKNYKTNFSAFVSSDQIWSITMAIDSIIPIKWVMFCITVCLSTSALSVVCLRSSALHHRIQRWQSDPNNFLNDITLLSFNDILFVNYTKVLSIIHWINIKNIGLAIEQSSS